MDIDEFYEADPRRRPSAELELGAEWADADGTNYELNYVEDTGELYVLREPQPHETGDPFGGIHFSVPPGYEKKMTVHVIANIASVDEVHKILDGWQQVMLNGSSEDASTTEWLGRRLRSAGVAVDDQGGDAIAVADPDPIDP